MVFSWFKGSSQQPQDTKDDLKQAASNAFASALAVSQSVVVKKTKYDNIPQELRNLDDNAVNEQFEALVKMLNVPSETEAQLLKSDRETRLHYLSQKEQLSGVQDVLHFIEELKTLSPSLEVLQDLQGNYKLVKKITQIVVTLRTHQDIKFIEEFIAHEGMKIM